MILLRNTLTKKFEEYELNKPFYEIKGFYYQNKEKKLLIYRNLVYFYQKIVIAKIPVQYESSVDTFINFFKKINKFINIFNTLYEKGYQEIFGVEIIIEALKINCCYNLNLYSLEELNQKFSDLKNEITTSLKNFYNRNEIIRLFYGRQLRFVYENINKKKLYKNIDLLKSISNNNILKSPTPEELKYIFDNLKQPNETNEYIKILNIIILYFGTHLVANNKKLEDIYNLNIIKQEKIKGIKNKFKGIYFRLSNNQEIDSLNIYKYLTDNLPISICFFIVLKILLQKN